MTQWHHRDRGPITEEKLLKAVHILADIVENHGSVFRPLYHDVRQQLAEFRIQEQADAAPAIAALPDNKVA
ncbi:hypothetical protein [Microvirga makkahensis]|uniref:Uncharacterized protein n=1 Tax=Microvirga makkahensis TaxID=1128670 RepID=A0A7X3SM85_9HYPH|nr:hypothetical protein [Microvirga makkahensis]MXQ10097.1 hypothetical protein [Microvirga makkahensis]